MGDDNSVGKGCLFGFGFGFGLLLAGVALVAVVGLFLGFLVLMAVPRLHETRERINSSESESAPEHAPELLESALQDLPHVETQTGAKGQLTARDGDYVDIRLPDGGSTWVAIDSLTEESQQVVRGTFPDELTETPR